ncbi:MAG TPA: tyrosine-type recombinase/integrase [Nitrospirota bacterium]|nr:tyrosine-type recombinase/integrase [Nitrospirota bacterium]
MAHCRFHDLRHTLVTRFVQAGVDHCQVHRLLGHQFPIMTQRYTHHYSEGLRDGVETPDRISTILALSSKMKVELPCKLLNNLVDEKGFEPSTLCFFPFIFNGLISTIFILCTSCAPYPLRQKP